MDQQGSAQKDQQDEDSIPAYICSDVEDDEPRPRQRKRNTANATMPRAGGTSKFFRRNSNQFTCVASKALAARKTRAGPKSRK